MNYQRHYNNLIETRKLLSRIKGEQEYFESHHIKPRCIGGSNENDNLVLLTAKEHFIAHWLLTKIYTGKDRAKLSFGFLRMCNSNSFHNRSFSSSNYENAKKQVVKNCSGENAIWFGRKHSPESKERMRLRMLGKNNPQFEKAPWNFAKSKETNDSLRKASETFKLNYKIENHPCFGKERPESVKTALSEYHKDKPKTQEQKNKISNALTGRKLSEDTKNKMSKTRKGKTQKMGICPHCGKECSLPTLSRWHMDKCKTKTQI